MKTFIVLTLVSTFSALQTEAQSTCQWTGSVSTNWFDAQNWDLNDVPDTTDNIVIGVGSFAPELTSDIIANNFEIQTGASFDAAGYQLSIKGNWMNYGVFNSGGGVVKFNGTNHQQIWGNTSFYELVVFNEYGLSNLSGCDTIISYLYIQSGFLETNDSLVLFSDSTLTASIGSLDFGNIYGEITFQRYINNTVAGWRFLSLPINYDSLNQIQDDILTSGFPGSTFPSELFASVYYYDETDSGDAYNGYEVPVSMDDELDPGKGFMVYIDSGNLINKLDFKGVPVAGSVDVPLTYTLTDTISDGWNLVGNPYPSAIDWDDESIYKQNMGDAIYVWDPANSVYTSYINGIGTNGGSNIIASGQAFYVRTNALNPKLLLDENCKIKEDSMYFKTVADEEVLKFRIQNSNGFDETVVSICPDATSGFDQKYDGLKMFSMDPNKPAIYTMDENDEYYSINTSSNTELNIPIYVYTAISENHTITFTGVESFHQHSCIYLEDLHTGIVYNLEETDSISVFISDTTTSARFLLKLGAPVYTQTLDASCYDFNDGEIQIAKNGSELMDILVKDVYGNILHQSYDIFQIQEIDNLHPGIYTVEIAGDLCGNQITSVQIVEPDPITASFELDQNTVELVGGTVQVNPVNSSVNANYYSWNFGNGTTSSSENPTASYTSAGTYWITLKAYQNPYCFETTSQSLVVIEDSVNSSGINSEEATEITYILKGQSLILESKHAGTLSIYSMNGSLVETHQFSEGNKTIHLDLPAEVYLIHIVSNNKWLVGKLSVQF